MPAVVKPLSTVRDLGFYVHVDGRMADWVAALVGHASLGQLRMVRPSLTLEVARTLVHQ